MRVATKREILQEKLDNMKGAVMMGKSHLYSYPMLSLSLYYLTPICALNI